MMEVLCLLVATIIPREDERNGSPDHTAQLRTIELRLQRLVQHEHTTEEPEATSTTSSHDVQLAELYRLSALIYLERVARNTPRTAPAVKALTTQALELLAALNGGCERPWPLFVIALEAVDEDQRRVVLDAWHRALESRPQGNLVAMRRMVEAAWAMEDLAGRALDMMGVYEVVISANKVPPSFT